MGNDDAERVVRRILDQDAAEVERMKSVLVSCINRLTAMGPQGWRKAGNDLVDWMEREANDMASVERDVAITRTAGGSASIVGGVMTGAGIVASFFTYGLAAPLAVAGMAVAGAGAATSAGGDIAKLSIVHMKTREIKKRCQSFEQRSESIVAVLVELRMVMTELLDLWEKHKMSASDTVAVTTVVELVLKSGKSARNLVTAGVNTYKIAAIVYDISRLQRSGVIFGADYLLVVAGSITGSSLSISKALFTGAGAVVGVGFGIWDVVEASGTLQNGGSHCELIRDNAKRLKNTIREIDKALCQLDL